MDTQNGIMFNFPSLRDSLKSREELKDVDRIMIREVGIVPGDDPKVRVKVVTKKFLIQYLFDIPEDRVLKPEKAIVELNIGI